MVDVQAIHEEGWISAATPTSNLAGYYAGRLFNGVNWLYCRALLGGGHPAMNAARKIEPRLREMAERIELLMPEVKLCEREYRVWRNEHEAWFDDSFATECWIEGLVESKEEWRDAPWTQPLHQFLTGTTGELRTAMSLGAHVDRSLRPFTGRAHEPHHRLSNPHVLLQDTIADDIWLQQTHSWMRALADYDDVVFWSGRLGLRKVADGQQEGPALLAHGRRRSWGVTRVA